MGTALARLSTLLLVYLAPDDDGTSTGCSAGMSRVRFAGIAR